MFINLKEQFWSQPCGKTGVKLLVFEMMWLVSLRFAQVTL